MATHDHLASGTTPALDFLVQGRRSRARRLTLDEKKAQLARTVNRLPEVMVKVSGGGKTPAHVKAHMDYITRHGVLEATDDQGEKISGKEAVKDLHDSWDLDAAAGQGRYRQATNLVLSMPAGTNPDGLFKAVQHFAREQFFGQHAYMMVLHTPLTDPHPNPPPHPHVHLVVKAEGFDGKRLHIHKAKLETWRTMFADYLREEGIEANATPRDLRGQTRKPIAAGLHYATLRGQSHVMESKFDDARQGLTGADHTPKPWEAAIVRRRQAILASLLTAAGDLRREGDDVLATAVERYARQLPRPQTERHQIQRAIAGQEREPRTNQETKHEQMHADHTDRER